jgi:hypothetical protein
MKIVFTLVVLILLCLTANAQTAAVSNGSVKFQSVSGDFAKSWLENYQAANPRPVPQVNNTSLWGWGSIPKGKDLIGGKLVDNYSYSQDMTANWLGDYYLNPYTSEPINPANYPGYFIPAYSSPEYLNPYSAQQQLPLTLLYP